MKFAVEVPRLPGSARRRDLEWRIVEEGCQRDGGPPHPRLESGDVHEGFEGASRWAARLGAAIELRQLVVAPTHESDDLSGLGANRNDATLKHAGGIVGDERRELAFELFDALAQRCRRQALGAALEGRIHLDSLTRQHGRVVGVRELNAQEVEKIPRVAGVGCDRREAQGFCDRRVTLRGFDPALLGHQLQHQIAALARAPSGLR